MQVKGTGYADYRAKDIHCDRAISNVVDNCPFADSTVTMSENVDASHICAHGHPWLADDCANDDRHVGPVLSFLELQPTLLKLLMRISLLS